MKDKTFKQLESELSDVLYRVEHSEYEELEDLLTDYKTGKKIIAELENRLETAKNSIKKVSKDN